MAQKGKKKPSGPEPLRKEGGAADRPQRAQAREGDRSADWSPSDAGDPEAELLDVDPAYETVEKAREFGSADNPFEEPAPRGEDPTPAPLGEDREPESDTSPDRRMTQPPLGDEDSGLEEAFGLEKGIVHIVDREDMGKGVQKDPGSYAQGPGKPGLVAGATPSETGEGFLDPAARAGQARASAEDVLRSRGMAAPGDWSPAGEDAAQFSGAGFLDALFIDHPFPATKESLTCALAQEAWQRGGPAEAFHDLVVQLDQGLFQDLADLKRALGDRFMWESTHGQRHFHGGGPHGR